MKNRFIALILSVLLLFIGCGTEQNGEFKSADEIVSEYIPVVYGEMYIVKDTEQSKIDMFTPVTEESVADIDFTKAVIIENNEQFYGYVRYCMNMRWCNVIVHFTAEYGSAPDENGLLDRFSLPYCKSYRKLADNNSTYAVYSFQYYDGVLAADGKEGEKYDEIRNAADELLKSEDFIKLDDYGKELAIAEFICDKAEYHKNAEKEALNATHTAYGAMINGKANCQGYADAFQMLCIMAGIPCGKVTGRANGTSHVWNTVQLNGKWYMTDIVWMDTVFEHIYYGAFNSSTEQMSADHFWEDDYLQEDVTGTLDDNYYYYRNDLFVTDEALSEKAAELIRKNGKADIMTEKQTLSENFINEVADLYGADCEISMESRIIGDYLYISVYL